MLVQLVAATVHLYLKTTVFSCVTENYNSRSNLHGGQILLLEVVYLITLTVTV